MPFLILACTNATNHKATNVIHFDSGFSLYQDTVFVDVIGEMTHALKYHDKFYVLFEQKVMKYGGYGKRWLYIIANGEVEKIVDCPKEMKTVYLDFFVKNDSIILKPYMNKEIYYLNVENFTWKEIDKADDLIFEDEKFYVYSLDFGEWGGKTWFKDKKTGIEYVIEATSPLVNKIDTIYYFTGAFKVLKIENPLELNKCDDDVTYGNIEKTGKYYSWYGKPTGFDVVYKDTTVNHYDYSYKSNIVSSFIWQNELLHIYETDTATYIAKIENNTIKTIQKIGEELSFFIWHYSYRCRNLNGNNELLKFRTKDEQSFGLMDIIDNKTFVCYFVNNAELEPKSLGTVKADSIFINRFNLILSEFDNMQLKDVVSEEKKWGSFYLSPFIVNRGLNENSESYLIQEDSLISNSIIYYATQTNNLIRVSFEWENTSYSRFDLDKLTRETFITKLNFLETFLTQKLGQPVSVLKEKDKYPATFWKTTNGLTVELRNGISNKYLSNNRIRLYFYKN